MPHQLPSVIYLKLCMQYEIDGRDPSGYVGCMWSICGIHNQVWIDHFLLSWKDLRVISIDGNNSLLQYFSCIVLQQSAKGPVVILKNQRVGRVTQLFLLLRKMKACFFT